MSHGMPSASRMERGAVSPGRWRRATPPRRIRPPTDEGGRLEPAPPVRRPEPVALVDEATRQGATRIALDIAVAPMVVVALCARRSSE